MVMCTESKANAGWKGVLYLSGHWNIRARVTNELRYVNTPGPTLPTTAMLWIVILDYLSSQSLRRT